MYEKIKSHPTTRALYAKRLIDGGLLTEQTDDEWVEHYREALERNEPLVSSLVSEPNKALFVDWSPYIGHRWDVAADTSVPLAELKALSERTNELPEGFSIHRVVKKLMSDRLKMGAGAQEVNWGFAETMAYASLLDAGYPVRLTGQDVGRGTFSHRHVVLHNQRGGESYVPMMHLGETQAPFRIYDSLLSEEAVLAFEYGYATTSPGGLVVWEAQFGDFANGAQVVIDQFISSGENKWNRLCGLTMLLPHGYEGQGPEHSSARLERFLQLCAEDNIQVCIPSTPAQVFHMLRRQAIRPLRIPLVVMTPKSLLRHKEAVSPLEDLARGHVPDGNRRNRCLGAGGGEESASVCGQGFLRPQGGTTRACYRRHCHHPYRADVSFSPSRFAGGARTLPQHRRRGVGPGRAKKSGNLVRNAKPISDGCAARKGRRVSPVCGQRVFGVRSRGLLLLCTCGSRRSLSTRLWGRCPGGFNMRTLL